MALNRARTATMICGHVDGLRVPYPGNLMCKDDQASNPQNSSSRIAIMVSLLSVRMDARASLVCEME